MKLSVIIVNYNVCRHLERCLCSLPAALGVVEWEALVIDNASTDGSDTYIPTRFPHIIYIYNKVNVGFAKACNQGIRRATGEYILLLNPDTELLPDQSLSTAVEFMETHPEAGAAGARMYAESGAYLPESGRGYPTPAAAFGKLTGLARFFSGLKGYYAPVEHSASPCEVDVLAGAFMLLRRSALDVCGLLDEDFFMYGEDIDLSCRLRAAGYRNYSLPLRIRHTKGASTNRRSAFHLRCFYGSMAIFYRKHSHGDSRPKRFLVQAGIRLLWAFKYLQLAAWRLFHPFQ